jgi:hypothetical protein
VLVRVRLDQAGIDGHALAADQAFLDAAGDGRLEQMTQQLAVSKPTVAASRPMSELNQRNTLQSSMRFSTK